MHKTPTPSQLLLQAGTTALCTRLPPPANYYCMQGSQLCAQDSRPQPIIIACRDHSSVHKTPTPSQLLLQAGTTALCTRLPPPANYYCMQGSQLCAQDSRPQPIIIACRDHSSVHKTPAPSQLLLHAGITALCTRLPPQPIIIACRDHSSVHKTPAPSQLLLHAGTIALCTRLPPPANYYCMQGPQLCAQDSHPQPIIIACRDHSSVHETPTPSQLLLHAGITVDEISTPSQCHTNID